MTAQLYSALVPARAHSALAFDGCGAASLPGRTGRGRTQRVIVAGSCTLSAVQRSVVPLRVHWMVVAFPVSFFSLWAAPWRGGPPCLRIPCLVAA